MKSKWPTKKLGEKEYFEILGSGIEKFEGEKQYLSTSSIEGNKIIAPECKITYWKRPSRANMQPRLNSVWFARMINTIKVYSFTESNKGEIDKYILSTGFAGILCNPEKVDPRYLEKIFLSKWFNDLKDSLASDKAIQKSLNNDDIKNLEIPLPPLPIQQKIVKILDAIQEAVEIQEKIIEKTKELKKSLMAELFKYGAPSFRKGRKLKKTEIGEIPENWEVVRLGEVAKIKTGKSNVEDAADEGKYLFFDRSGEVKKSNKYLFDKEAVIVPGEGKEFLPKYYCGKFDLHQRAYAIFDFSKQLNGKYLFYTIHYFNKILCKLAVGTTVKSLRLPMFQNFLIPLPSLPEQQEIAEILQTIDQKIEIEKKKKELHEELFRTMLNKIMNQEIDVEEIEV